MQNHFHLICRKRCESDKGIEINIKEVPHILHLVFFDSLITNEGS